MIYIVHYANIIFEIVIFLFIQAITLSNSCGWRRNKNACYYICLQMTDMLLLSGLQKQSSHQLHNTIEMSLFPNDKYGAMVRISKQPNCSGWK